MAVRSAGTSDWRCSGIRRWKSCIEFMQAPLHRNVKASETTYKQFTMSCEISLPGGMKLLTCQICACCCLREMSTRHKASVGNL